ncbi:MAG: hypothetical protein H0X26_02665 [Alphaproteobacteria bacterium]|nr:hypothetical protein [Alphaproteobacteria bacterium]
MINIKQLAFASVMTIAAVTHAFADKDSIYDDAEHVAGKTYYKLIDEAATAKLSEQECARFMDFVCAYPTNKLNNYDRITTYEMGGHPHYLDRQFFTEKVSKVLDYNFVENITLTLSGYEQLNKSGNKYPAHGLAWFDLRYALCGIVQDTSYKIVGSNS